MSVSCLTLMTTYCPISDSNDHMLFHVWFQWHNDIQCLASILTNFWLHWHYAVPYSNYSMLSYNILQWNNDVLCLTLMTPYCHLSDSECFIPLTPSYPMSDYVQSYHAVTNLIRMISFCFTPDLNKSMLSHVWFQCHYVVQYLTKTNLYCHIFENHDTLLANVWLQ